MCGASFQRRLDDDRTGLHKLGGSIVFLGKGVRFFDNLDAAPIALDGPIVGEGNGVTHLSYAVCH